VQPGALPPEGARHRARRAPWCAEHDVALVAYSPFGSGDFPSPGSAGGRALADIAKRHDATPRQVALAFLVREAPLFTIPKASRVAHVEEIAGAVGLELTEQDLADVERAFPLGRAPEWRPDDLGRRVVTVDGASSAISRWKGDVSTNVVDSSPCALVSRSTSCTAEIVAAATWDKRSGSRLGSGSCSIATAIAPITSAR
jgi:hypothetical protein